jgi:hypothetical protein
LSRLGHPEVEAGIVHQDYQIIATHPEVSLERPKQAVVSPNLRDDFNHAECRQTFHWITDSGARLLHPSPAQCFEDSRGVTPGERAYDLGRMKISGGLAGGDENARRAPRLHQ